MVITTFFFFFSPFCVVNTLLNLFTWYYNDYARRERTKNNEREFLNKFFFHFFNQ